MAQLNGIMFSQNQPQPNLGEAIPGFSLNMASPMQTTSMSVQNFQNPNFNFQYSPQNPIGSFNVSQQNNPSFFNYQSQQQTLYQNQNQCQMSSFPQNNPQELFNFNNDIQQNNHQGLMNFNNDNQLMMNFGNNNYQSNPFSMMDFIGNNNQQNNQSSFMNFNSNQQILNYNSSIQQSNQQQIMPNNSTQQNNPNFLGYSNTQQNIQNSNPLFQNNIQNNSQSMAYFDDSNSQNTNSSLGQTNNTNLQKKQLPTVLINTNNQQKPPLPMVSLNGNSSQQNNTLSNNSFYDIFKKFSENAMQHSLSQMNFKPKKMPAKPPRDPNEPPKKRGRPRKYEQYQVPKSSKKSQSDGSSNFEAFADDYIPKDLIACRAVVRENRKQINYAEDEDFDYDDDDEDDMDDKNAKNQPKKKLEHIYAMRRKNDTIQYLVKFPETGSSALCEWIPESEMSNYVNAKNLLQRQPYDITNISESSSNLLVVAHKRTQTGFLYLYKFSYDANVIFFWDFANENVARKYFQNRIRVPLFNPQIPTGTLPIPSTRTIVSTTNEELKGYQVEGLKWLLTCWQKGHGSILADEMGLGKTIQILAFLSYINTYSNWHGPFLIAVRTNCFKQWCDEIERWTNLKYIAYNSGPSQRAIMREFMFPCLDDNGDPIPQSISFNILLVSYDVFLKDIVFLGKYLWEVIVVDEGHRIKNCYGKKNRALSDLRAKQRIILTGTPIQNTLSELWTLLRFVSPSYFQDPPAFMKPDSKIEIDNLDKETVLKTRNMISPHLLRRSLSEAERLIAPKEERVVFISLTQPQKDMIRLIKLHKLWRIKGVQTSDVEMDSSHEANALAKVCSHPFLIEGAEEYYTKKLNLSRLELILATSSKFQWLDKVLLNLRSHGHKVLIFSQRVKLLKLLSEYCQLRNFPNQMLIGSMGEIEKNAAIAQFSDENSDEFIFLISTRAGSEGLNLTVANITIIFDPDWNPQNDLQAQGRCHRIGQTQKVDVLRLITYQTYEHEMFVRAQRKLGLWLTLLGSEPVNDETSSVSNEPPLEAPPAIHDDVDPSSMSLNSLLEHISTIANDFSLSALDRLWEPLNQKIDYSDGTSDEAFIETFPVEIDDGFSRRAKRIKSREVTLSPSSARLIFEKLKVYGYGHIEPLTESLQDFAYDQVERFAINAIVFAFRALEPQFLPYFPILIHHVLTDYPEFQFKNLYCANKHHWLQIFDNDHDLDVDIDIQAVQYIKDELLSNPMEFLSIIEMKLIGYHWQLLSKEFEDEKLPPPISDKDKETFNKILSFQSFNPFDERTMVIINSMRSDLILKQYDSCAFHIPWWSEIEFQVVVDTLKNFPFSPENPIAFHAKTGLLSKTTTDVLGFALQLKRLCIDRKKGSVMIPKNIIKLSEMPSSLLSLKGFLSWTTMPVRESDDVKNRIELLSCMKTRYDEIPDSEDQELDYWNESYEKKFYELVFNYGFYLMNQILLDKRFGFIKFLSSSDIQYLKGEKSKRSPGSSDIPDFLFNESELSKYLTNNGSRKLFNDDSGEWRIEFAMPAIKKISFYANSLPKKRKDQEILMENLLSLVNQQKIKRKLSSKMMKTMMMKMMKIMIQRIIFNCILFIIMLFIVNL